MRKFNVFSAVTIIIILVIVTLAMANGPVGDIVTITWCEDAIRYYPNGDVKQEWINDCSFDDVEMIQTGKAYHIADIAQYFNYYPLVNLEGKLVISGAGRLSGHATYISPGSGLPIEDRFKGEVTIDAERGTMVGTYTQWSYAFGTEVIVLEKYPNAIKCEECEEELCWWLVGYTEYVAHIK